MLMETGMPSFNTVMYNGYDFFKMLEYLQLA